MSEISELFNIENCNLIKDENYYYLFRALNNGDHADKESGIITDDNGRIIRIRTDRSRYIENPQNGTPKYEENEPISLLQVIDHIKEHHRYDTNCISLSSNANVSIMYGNGYYSEYTVIRVPKGEIGEKVINAGEYMLEEMNKKIEQVISRIMVTKANITAKNQKILELVKEIDEADTREELLDIMASSYKLGDANIRRFTGKKDEIRGKKPLKIRLSEYSTLSNEQNLIKNKIIAKLTILEEHHLMEPIMPNAIIDSRAIETLESAFSSRELIHYGEIGQDNLFEASKEFIHMLGLLQQTAENQPELLENYKIYN